MDMQSSSDDPFINEELHEATPTRKVLPFQSLLRELHNITKTSFGFFYTDFEMDQIWTLKREVKFLQMVFMFLKSFTFSNYEAPNDIQTIAETNAQLIEKTVTAILDRKKRAYRCFFYVEYGVSKFLKTIDQEIKSHLREFCLEIVDRLLQDNSSGDYDLSEFLNTISFKLKDLEIQRPNMSVPMKKQTETVKEMLHFVHILAGKKRNVNLRNLLEYFQPWVNIATTIVILYWVDEKDEELFTVVSPLFHKFSLSILELVEAYIVVMKVLKPSKVSEILMMRETVGHFTNLVLENFIVSTNDGFEILREGLTLWIALLVDPPQAEAEHEKVICAQIDLLVDKAESLIRSLCLEKLGEDIAEIRNILLNDFLENINKAKTQVRQLHVEIPKGLLWNSVPRTNGRGFFDFILGNLQKKLEYGGNKFPFEKHVMAIVHKELSLLRPFLMDIFELQDNHKELIDIWVQASNVAYLVDNVTDSCLSSVDVSIWSNLMHLSHAIEKIQFVQTEVSKFRQNYQMYKDKVISAEENTKTIHPRRQQANEKIKDDIKVGFRDEERILVDRLTAGEAGLDIVAIVGMGGQGKTTLAQRVFQGSWVKLHFNMYALCCVSQAYDIKEILLQILKDICPPDQFEKLGSFVSHEDLVDRLRKCLKGQRYLIVLDDMWDAKAWYDLPLSFPDDNNKSRILLTSRNRNVPLELKPTCCIVELGPLQLEESWKLLQIKVFEEDLCPPILFNIGKTIAENCKGLPLAIVVVAGLLRKDENENSWKQISESLKTILERQGCMSILDLSYNHLPDYLKPCFLYLAKFHENEKIDAKKLIQFWIVEGFIQNDGMKSKEIIANECLKDLVLRSLVFVAERSSRNGIKKCRLHDLLHELCVNKAKEERFLWVNGHILSIGYGWKPFADSECTGVWSLFGTKYFSTYDIFRNFKILRVLDLDQCSQVIDFDQIIPLIHLQLLSINRAFVIPSSVVSLFRLEVLRVRSLEKRFLPSVLMEMENLRHIYVCKYCIIDFEEDFDELGNSNLETFTTLMFFEKSGLKRVARRLSNVLKLGLELCYSIGLSSYFKKLESLNLVVACLEDISPSTLDFPSTLKKLKLQTTRPLSPTMISAIGKLNNLEVLKLIVKFEKAIWDVEDDEFLKLKYLELVGHNMKGWNVSDQSFPCLEQLIIKQCVYLRELPDKFGAISTLKRIEAHYCSIGVLDSFQQIVDEQMDSGNNDLQISVK